MNNYHKMPQVMKKRSLACLLFFLIATLSGDAWAQSAPGFLVRFGAAFPAAVKVSLNEVWTAPGEAVFHTLNSSLRIEFKVRPGERVSNWALQVACRGSSTALFGNSASIYTRPMIAVNGSTVNSDVILGGVTRTYRYSVGKLLKSGTNVITIALGGDSRSQFLLSSIKAGP